MFVHPTAIVEDDATVGDGTYLWHHVMVRRGAIIGSQCILGYGVHIDTDVIVGNRVKIQNYVSVFHGVTIEDGVFVGPHAVFTNDKFPRAINSDGTLKSTDDWVVSETRVGYGATIGANATIVCGITLGKWSMVGAGSVVTKDVPDYGLVVGNPARLIGYVTPGGQRVDQPPA
jgi:UDP-2-acetamido-3-amino-2,3-dideoxy-glucuronate N-acetyltransferase